MSALLPIDALELNLNAEYGYTVREFSKVPHVYQSDNYKSGLFLFYHQDAKINHRIDKYRNHFTLFRNEKSIIIVRTETTFIHADNDAILTYDVITPSENANERFRSSFKNWDVSFDKITYSSKQPETIVGYTLIGSGEWWFYDNGIVLVGKSGYKQNTKCQSILIYYELHVDHKITLPSNDSLLSMPPVLEVVLKYGNNQTSNVNASMVQQQQQQQTPIRSINPELAPIKQTIDSLAKEIYEFTGTKTDAKFYYLDENLNANLIKLDAIDTSDDDTLRLNKRELIKEIYQLSTELDKRTVGENSKLTNQSLINTIQRPTFMLSSIPNSLLPQINSASRPIIRKNDVVETKNIINKSVMPSLFWFNSRCKELITGNIDYFKPQDFICAPTLKQKNQVK